MSSIKGINEITKKINQAVAQLKKSSSKGLKDAAVHIANEAIKRTPIESGDLRNSVYVDLDGKRIASGQEEVRQQLSGQTNVAGISADVGESHKMAEIGFSSKYAAKQHEDLSLRHDRTDGYTVPEINVRTGKPNKHAGKTVNKIPGGQAKFLESVLVEDQDRILRHIADAVDLGGSDD